MGVCSHLDSRFRVMDDLDRKSGWFQEKQFHARNSLLKILYAHNCLAEPWQDCSDLTGGGRGGVSLRVYTQGKNPSEGFSSQKQ